MFKLVKQQNSVQKGFLNTLISHRWNQHTLRAPPVSEWKQVTAVASICWPVGDCFRCAARWKTFSNLCNPGKDSIVLWSIFQIIYWSVQHIDRELQPNTPPRHTCQKDYVINWSQMFKQCNVARLTDPNFHDNRRFAFAQITAGTRNLLIFGWFCNNNSNALKISSWRLLHILQIQFGYAWGSVSIWRRFIYIELTFRSY